MLWLNMVDDFDFDTHEGQFDSINWESPKQLSYGDRVVVCKKGDQKVVAIGTIVNGQKNKISKENPVILGVNLRYDIVNPIGVPVGQQRNHTLSHQEFEKLLIRLVRGY